VPFDVRPEHPLAPTETACSSNSPEETTVARLFIRRFLARGGVRRRLIARFQRLTTELLIEKWLGRRRPELTYQTWLEVDQRGLKETPEYRNVMKRADRHALWLAGLVMLSNPDAVPPLYSKETQPIATDKAA
jgi:hypothetical protein